MKQVLIATAAALMLVACSQAAKEDAPAPVTAEVAADAPHIVAAVADSRRPAEDC